MSLGGRIRGGSWLSLGERCVYLVTSGASKRENNNNSKNHLSHLPSYEHACGFQPRPAYYFFRPHNFHHGPLANSSLLPHPFPSTPQSSGHPSSTHNLFSASNAHTPAPVPVENKKKILATGTICNPTCAIPNAQYRHQCSFTNARRLLSPHPIS